MGGKIERLERNVKVARDRLDAAIDALYGACGERDETARLEARDKETNHVRRR